MDPSQTTLPTLVQTLPFPSPCSSPLSLSPPTSPSSPSFDASNNSFKFPSPSGKSLLRVSEVVGIPRPLESLQSPPIPPFLSKTYEIVNDPSLDRVVSWSKAGQSFVVWDPVDFSRIVLPRHFKHSNFSSFVRQLNTYTLLRTAVHFDDGFRKIDGDRWEFANEEFLRGKRFLLKNINRRRSSRPQPVGSYLGSSMEMELLGTDDELQKLRSEKYMLTQEVLKMKQEHLVTVKQMDKLNCRLQSAELRQKQLMSFWIKVLRNPVFLMQLKQTKKLREIASKRSVKRSLEQEQPSKSYVNESTTQQIAKYRQSFCEPDSTCMLQGLESSSETQLPDHLLPDTSDKLGLDVNVQDGSSNRPPEILVPSFNPNASFKGKNIMILREDANLSSADFYVSSPEEFSSNKMVMEPISPVSESFTKQDLQIDTFNGDSAGEIQDIECHTQYLASPVDDFSQEPMFLYSVKRRGEVACNEEFWDVDFEAGSNFTSAHDAWGNLVCTNPVVPGDEIGLSAMWDFGLHSDEGFKIDKCFDSQFPPLQHMDEAGLSDNLPKISEL